MKHTIKKIVSFVLVLAIALTICIPAFAATSSNSSSVMLNGEKYTITQSVNDQGQKVVTVVSKNDCSSIVNTGDTLQISTTTSSGTQDHTISLTQKAKSLSPMSTASSGSVSSAFWTNFYCYWDTSNLSSSGVFWSMSCDNGGISAYDQKNTTARGYAESLRSDVQAIFSAEVSETAFLGVAEAGLIAAAISSETGVGVIAGVVVALGGTLAAVPYFVQAWTSAQNANYHFSLFNDAIYA